ncbi:hypothetical protein BS47DRAFT_1449953 [Hydnum rufescens UP504]|uniref:Uncharacterized protein n=1 Tax=Hydnum rufescens UP504 TaxID=1448309 RepID=A0A9P6DLU1_9AGAM|nr:hypothetical protein BS47DRAFT_1449953 [Hydnum rufescens UP504]
MAFSTLNEIISSYEILVTPTINYSPCTDDWQAAKTHLLFSPTLEDLAANPFMRLYHTDPENHKPMTNDTRPSIYLQYRCPACFGGTQYPKDGQHGMQDYAFGTPCNLFLSTSETSAMSKYYTETKAVESLQIRITLPMFEKGEWRFIAIKITKEFSDKGLIVLACQHDCVLWFINMGPNEMEQPSVATVAPIVCHVSNLPRPFFTHMVINGCANCRTTHTKILSSVALMVKDVLSRLFVINTKQAYINGQNLCKLASHQKWHFDDTVAKLNEAEGALDRLGIPIDEIQTAWAEQLSTQQAEPPHNGFESQLAKKEYNLLLHDHKARVHEAKVDKKRQPAVIRCLDQLNKEIECMLDAWDDAPRGAIRPEKLDRKGLFSLNVDGAIWKGLHILEAGLGDNRGATNEYEAIHEAGTDSPFTFTFYTNCTDLNNLGECGIIALLSDYPTTSNYDLIMPFRQRRIGNTCNVTVSMPLLHPFPKGLTPKNGLSEHEDCIQTSEYS